MTNETTKQNKYKITQKSKRKTKNTNEKTAKKEMMKTSKHKKNIQNTTTPRGLWTKGPHNDAELRLGEGPVAVPVEDGEAVPVLVPQGVDPRHTGGHHRWGSCGVDAAGVGVGQHNRWVHSKPGDVMWPRMD